MPTGARQYLLLQRTEYQRPMFRSLFETLGLKNLYDKHLINYLDKNSTDELLMKYYEDLKAEYKQMKKYLPESVDNIIDIGCGLGGINLFIHEHYDQDIAHHLLDRNEQTDIYYMFNQDPVAYNSLKTTVSFLRKNGANIDKLNPINITAESYPSEINFELVISLLSWGFHYPIETYLNNVKQSMVSNGCIIIDVRNSSGAFEKVKKILIS